MANQEQSNNENTLLEKLQSSDYWGAYLKNQFYFKINTKKSREQAGIAVGQGQLSSEQQRKLQIENLPALFHEFLHYFQETSTMVGLECMAQDIRMKSAFMHWLNPDLSSAESLGVRYNPSVSKAYVEAKNVIDVLDGNGPEITHKRKIFEILDITYEDQEVAFAENEINYYRITLNIPKVKFRFSSEGDQYHDILRFGRFFLYEGIAYELDREIDKQTLNLTEINDIHRNSEYTILRLLAQYLYPKATKRTFLSLAILSLQAMECGKSFIDMMNVVKENEEKGISQEETVTRYKHNISGLLSANQLAFNENQDAYSDHFRNRKQFHEAYTYVISVIKNLYVKRIENPSFEVDIVLDEKFLELLDITQVCDYMYKFLDQESIMRDFLGSTLPEEIAQSLKTIIAFDHYFYAHRFQTTEKTEMGHHECPFYYCCDLKRRVTDSLDCRTKPWRVFEKDRKDGQQYCWYGQAVGNAKGHTKPTQTSNTSI